MTLLSYNELVFWLAHQANPQSPAHHVSGALRILGRLDAATMREAFTQLVERHPALRTTFPEVDGTPRRVVHERLDVAIDIRDAADDAVPAIIDELVRRPFDVAHGPLFRVSVLSTSADEHILVLVFHHIVSDLWSAVIAVDDLGRIYSDLLADRHSSLRPLRTTYAEVAAQQRSLIAGADGSALLAHWAQVLDGTPGATHLPSDRAAPAVASGLAGAVQRVLPAQMVGPLSQLAREAGTTPPDVILTALAVVLRRQAGTEDVTIGIARANRSAATARVVGCFVNMLPLRVQIDDDEAFGPLVSDIAARAVDATRHQAAPVAAVIEHLAATAGRGREPLYNVGFVWQKTTKAIGEGLGTASALNRAGWRGAMGDLVVESFELPVRPAMLDLTLLGAPVGDEIVLTLDYAVDLFDEWRAQQLLDQVVHTLEQSIAAPAAPLRTIELLPRDHPRRHVPLPPDSSGPFLPERVRAQARATPDAPAVTDSNGTWTYDEFDARTEAIARALGAAGVRAGDVVAVELERSRDAVAAVHAVLRVGAAYVPIETSLPAGRRTQIVDDAGSAAIVTSATGGAAGRSTARVPVLLIEEISPRPDTADRQASTIDASQIAYVIYTSGSTGQPKGVEVTHRNLRSLLSVFAERPGLGPDDRVLQVASLGFDLSVPDVLVAPALGAHVHIVDSGTAVDGHALAQTVERARPTMMQATPTTWRLLLAAGWTGHSDLRIVAGGEHLDRRLANDLLDRGDELWNFYGPTEATVWSTCTRIHQSAERITIGAPLANTVAYVRDEHGDFLPDGMHGELYIGGHGVALGYRNQPELTAERFVTHPDDPTQRLYRTGDLVQRLPSGEFEYLGRSDNQVKIRGHRIELEEIEAALTHHPGVASGAVIAHTYGPDDVRLVAYYTPTSGPEDATPTSLRARLSSVLPSYMVPSVYAELDALPLTANGKVDRQRLVPPAVSATGHSAPPLPGVETVIAEIWAGVLGVESVGRDDDFFDLGGHSLLATMVVSRMRRGLDVHLPVSAVFAAPTVAGLAAAAITRLADQGGDSYPPQIARADRDGPLALSTSQERMWFLNQLHPDDLAYNMSGVVRLRGALDVGALRTAFGLLIERHESLRTWFDVDAGRPVQRIEPVAYVTIPLHEHTETTADERFHAAIAAIRHEMAQPFDLRTVPLLRASLHRLDGLDHLLYLDMHHIIGDQWSFGVIATEISELYRSVLDGDPPHLPELAHQHADFVAWHRQWLESGALDRQLNYWRRQLADLPVVDLPTDRLRPAVQRSAGDSVVVPLPNELAARVAALGAAHGASSFMVYLACFELLVHRYTGATDIPIGSPIANRTSLESEQLISSFVNTLVLRADLTGDPTFTGLLERVRATAVDAYANQDVPFDRLVSELRVPRDPSRAALFQLFFNLQNAPASLPDLRGVEAEIVPMRRHAAQFDLSMSIDSEWARTISIEYRTDLFDRWRIEAMAGHYLRLVQAAIDDPEQLISALPLMTAAELEATARDASCTQHTHPGWTVQDLIGDRAAASPERLAIVSDGESISYGELDNAANRLAHHLIDVGVRRGDIVGVYLERSPQVVPTLVAILRSGGAYLPLDPAFPADRLAFMRDDAGVRTVVTTSDLAAHLPPEVVAVTIDDIDLGDQPTTPPGAIVADDDVAYVMYTSGSTGRPKGVQIEHRNVTNFLHAMAERPGIGTDDVLLSITTLSFDISVLEIFGPLIAGGQVVLADRATALDPAALATMIDRYQPTIVQATPTTWRMLVSGGWRGSQGMRALCGGEPLSPHLASDLIPLVGELWNMYGPTETTVWSTVALTTDPDARITIGTAIDNTTLHVLDTNRQPLPTGVPGELYIGGAGVARGYLNRPELTAERFVDLPGAGRAYATGDLVTRLPSGELEHLGRIDNQIKLRGHRIELGEIEAVLASHPAVADAVVTTHTFGPGDVRLVGYVTHDGPAPTSADLREHVKQTLPPYMVPAVCIALDAFPLTPNKKVDRNALPAPTADAPSDPADEPPRPGIERTLADIWGDVLGIDTPSRNADFFDLGGHSLLAVRVFARLEDVTGIKAPITSLFRAPTIASLAATLSAEWQSPFTSLVAAQPEGDRQPLFVVAPFLITAVSFAPLARLLGDDQPLYVFQPQGMDSDDAPHTTVAAIAEHYIAEMRRVQPNGPYALAGHCAGAWVALEMAAQLQAADHDVRPLVLVDSEPPGVAPPPRRRVGQLVRRLWHYTRDQRLRHALVWQIGLARERVRARRTSSTERGRVAHVRAVHADAHRDYRGNRFEGDAWFLRSRESAMLTDKDWHLRWDEVIDGTLHVRVVPGAHSTLLVHPAVDDLAAHLREALHAGAAVQSRQ